jgi:hypothetical protein
MPITLEIGTFKKANYSRMIQINQSNSFQQASLLTLDENITAFQIVTKVEHGTSFSFRQSQSPAHRNLRSRTSIAQFFSPNFAQDSRQVCRPCAEIADKFVGLVPR